MSTNADLDRLADAWLADGPTELADRVLDAALREVHETHQRRPLAPWRTSRMPSLLQSPAGRALAAVIVAAVAIGGVYVTSQSIGPWAATTPPATNPPVDTSSWTTYVSTRYGLQFRVPPRWTVAPAHRSGPGIAADEVDSPGVQARFFAISWPADPTVDEAAWWAAYLLSNSDVSPLCAPREPGSYATIVLDGHLAHLFDASAACGYGRAIALVGGRTYELTSIPFLNNGNLEIIDHAMFVGWLSTVRFDPPAANDGPLPT